MFIYFYVIFYFILFFIILIYYVYNKLLKEINKVKKYTEEIYKNEEIHIERCINNIKKLFSDVLIIDSFSNDNTIEIAKKLNIKFIQNKFILCYTINLYTTNITISYIS